MEQSPLSALLRKFRSAAKAVALPTLLAAGAATSALLAPEPAKAAIVTQSYNCTFFAVGGTDCTEWQHGDKKVSNFGFFFNEIPTSAPIDVNIQYSWVYDNADPLNYAGDQWKVEVSAPPGQNFLPTFDLTYFYDIEIIDGPGFDSNGFAFDGRPWQFDRFGVGQTATFDRTTTLKTVDPNNTDAVLELSCLTTADGGTDCDGLQPLLSSARKVTVSDRVVVTEQGLLTSVQNSWTQKRVDQVPGPLSILGAGVAFGYSRKLRRRISRATAV